MCGVWKGEMGSGGLRRGVERRSTVGDRLKILENVVGEKSVEMIDLV